MGKLPKRNTNNFRIEIKYRLNITSNKRISYHYSKKKNFVTPNLITNQCCLDICFPACNITYMSTAIVNFVLEDFFYVQKFYNTELLINSNLN